MAQQTRASCHCFRLVVGRPQGASFGDLVGENLFICDDCGVQWNTAVHGALGEADRLVPCDALLAASWMDSQHDHDPHDTGRG